MSRAILSVGIHGAAGRMGTRLIQLIAEDPALKLGGRARSGRASASRRRCRHPGGGFPAGRVALIVVCPRIASSTS